MFEAGFSRHHAKVFQCVKSAPRNDSQDLVPPAEAGSKK